MGAEGTTAGAAAVADGAAAEAEAKADEKETPAAPADDKGGDKGGEKPEDKSGESDKSDKSSIVTEAPEQPTEPNDKVPEKYELTLPDDSLLDEGAIERTAAQAKEQGLSNDAAQEFLNRQSQALADHVEKQSETWAAEVEADPEIGGKNKAEAVEMARRIVTRFGTPAFKETMNKWGYGNHKEVIRVFSRIGKAMGEDKLISGATKPASSKPKSPADILYGDPNKKEG